MKLFNYFLMLIALMATGIAQGMLPKPTEPTPTKPKPTIEATIILPSNNPSIPSSALPKQVQFEQKSLFGKSFTELVTEQFDVSKTELFTAIAKNDAKAVEALLKKSKAQNKVLANVENKGGWSALMKAHNSPEITRLLIDAGATVNAKNSAGVTALREAAIAGNNEVVALLIRNNANPNLGDGYNITPLMMAALQGHETTVFRLLELGAKANAVDNSGQSALDYVDFGVASEAKKAAIKKLLLKKGAEKGEELL